MMIIDVLSNKYNIYCFDIIKNYCKSSVIKNKNKPQTLHSKPNYIFTIQPNKKLMLFKYLTIALFHYPGSPSKIDFERVLAKKKNLTKSIFIYFF